MMVAPVVPPLSLWVLLVVGRRSLPGYQEDRMRQGRTGPARSVPWCAWGYLPYRFIHCHIAASLPRQDSDSPTIDNEPVVGSSGALVLLSLAEIAMQKDLTVFARPSKLTFVLRNAPLTLAFTELTTRLVEAGAFQGARRSYIVQPGFDGEFAILRDLEASGAVKCLHAPGGTTCWEFTQDGQKQLQQGVGLHSPRLFFEVG